MQAIIIDRGRGPEIAGTRITVYDIMDYYKQGWHHTGIAATLRISSAKVIAAVEYIESHKDEVLAEYQKILDRHARGNPPEIEAKRVATRARIEALLAERRKNAKADSCEDASANGRLMEEDVAQHAAIIDRGRGPEIAGTRITVYDIMDYYKQGWQHFSIAATLRLSSMQVIAAIQYIESHKEEVLAEYQKMLDRDARGNSPEIQARLAATHEKVQLLLAARRRQADEELLDARDRGGC